VRIEYGLALAENLADGKVNTKALKGLVPELEEAQNWLEALGKNGTVGFMDLPFQEITPLLDMGNHIRSQFRHFLLIGIGGSALGAETLAHTLWHIRPCDMPAFHVLDNVDPVKTREVLGRLDPRETCFCVVSKSGSTAESMANFLVILEWLKDAVGEDGARERVIFITDPYKGGLRDLAKEEGYCALAIPPNVGGRFSVLSAVGLLPAVVLGLNVEGLLRGASLALRVCRTRGLDSNPAWIIAGLHYLHCTLGKKGISVMMAYHERLTTFVDWYRQLWAESLGKGGKGQTPVKAVGAVDQHSQIQLYNEGPKDKIITFLRVESFSSDIEIPSLYPDKPALAYLGGHSLGELMNKELVGTASALAKRGVPSVTISMPQVDELNLGALFMVYEMATALTGHLYGINPFDQPGVEEGKRLTYGLMGRPGFEDKGKEAREIWEKNEKAVFALSLEE